jgi:hypothetical protein
MKYHRVIALAVLVTLLMGVAPITALAQQPNRGITVPFTVNGMPGTFTIQQFANQGGQIVAIGTVAVQTAQGAITAGTTAVAVQQITGTCDILHLVLGPLHLDLLGLVVDLNQVVLDIVAQTGAGNLLGNLLCAIAGLLDPPGPLNRLVNLLNQLLAALG